MRLNGQSSPSNAFITLASFVIIAAVLSVAREVFIPIALASLLSFLLAPLVLRLGRWGLGKVLSVVLVVSLAFAVIAVLGWLVTTQMIHLANQLPNYQQNLRAKMLSLQKPHGSGLVSKATGMFHQLRKEVDSLTPPDEAIGEPGKEPEKPLPVEVKKPRPSPFELIGSLLGPLMKPLATAGAVVFFVIFMLLKREDLRERFLKLVSRGELNVATQAVDDAAQRVSRFLLMQLIVNVTYGLPIGVGLYFIGVPNAFLWGLLATLLRFIPFIGPWVAASFPLVLAFAVDPGWAKVALVTGLFVVVEVVSNNIVEPWLYGASTGVSNIALLMAAVFWTWLWGTVGLLLSTPLTVCLLVLGKYVPGLSFLNVLLGNEPVLDPDARFYQRMLAQDEDELLALSEAYIEERSVAELYDAVMIPALSLAEEDRHKGALAELRQTFIVQTTRELIEMVDEGQTQAEGDLDNPPAKVLDENAPASVLCIPAKDDADELAGLMLERLLRKKGIAAQAVSVKSLPRDWFKQIRQDGIKVVCVSSVPPYSVTPARMASRRLKHEFPGLKVVVGIWGRRAQPTELAHRLGGATHDAIVTRLPEAVARIEVLLRTEATAPKTSDLPELAERNGLPRQPAAAPEPEEIFDSVTRQVAKILNVPVSLVSFVTMDQEFWKTHGGLPPDLGNGQALRETSLCAEAALGEDVIDVEDVTKDPRFANDTLLQERGIRFYTGVPLRSSDGHVVGTLCVTDTEPHQIDEEAKARLRALARRLIGEVERRSLLAA